MPGGWLLVSENGGPLNATQHDANLMQTHDRVVALEGTILTPKYISSIIQLTASQLRINYTDGSFDVFSLPIGVPTPRGTWAPSTVYNRGELVFVYEQGVYIVKRSHTSPATFDPNHQVGSPAENAYELWFFIPPGPMPSPVLSIGLTHTLLTTDVGRTLNSTNAGGSTVTVPLNLAVPVDSEIYFRQGTAGQITIAPAVGVTVEGITGYQLKSAAQGATMFLKKTPSANVWWLNGLLAPNP